VLEGLDVALLLPNDSKRLLLVMAECLDLFLKFRPTLTQCLFFNVVTVYYEILKVNKALWLI